MNGFNFKNDTLFVSFTATLPPEMGEIEWLAALKCRATANRLVNIVVPYGTKVFSKSVR